MKGNYNNVAPFYEPLSRLVFGDAIVSAQRFLIDFIKAGSTVLIVGGGTGWILEEIAKRHAGGLQITYVEVSEKMTVMSMKKNVGSNKVLFVTEAVEAANIGQKFDVVITPFVLDNFRAENAEVVFNKIHQCLLPGGFWLFADFQVTSNSRLWQKLLLKIMYLFFKLLCGVDADRLPDTTTMFEKFNYKKVSSKTFFKNFICSLVYKKIEPIAYKK